MAVTRWTDNTQCGETSVTIVQTNIQPGQEVGCCQASQSGDQAQKV